jgi:hypothetical protein
MGLQWGLGAYCFVRGLAAKPGSSSGPPSGREGIGRDRPHISWGTRPVGVILKSLGTELSILRFYLARRIKWCNQ